MALFSAGSASGAQVASTSSSRNLIEFKAGKMDLKGSKVVSDERKGTFYVYRERDTMLTHVCWKERNSSSAEDDLIVFPDDCKWKRVKKCTTGRVYLLKFNSTGKKHFFWMQEPKDTKDDEYAEKINKCLNDPDDSSLGGGGSDLLGGASTEQLISQMFGGAGGGAQEQMLQQLLQSGALGGAGGRLGSGGAGGGSSRARVSKQPATTTANSGGQKTSSTSGGGGSRPGSSVQTPTAMELAQFQNIMTSLSNAAASSGGQGSSSAPSGNADLSAALPLDTKDIVASEEAMAALTPHVPQDAELIPSASTEVKDSVNAPQFRQALSMFSSAFSSGQLAPVVNQFELGAEATVAATSGNMRAFVEAIDSAENPNKKNETSPAKDATSSDPSQFVTPKNNGRPDEQPEAKKKKDGDDDEKMDTSG